ncbi:MAG: rhomboid family intramembrane serine protease [Chlamydiia bacterium]|nr:rhomboid family intramembrane serine protease [Chlamydiia bacterium]
MRLLGILERQQAAKTFSILLNEKGIEHQIDIKQNRDWGSEAYGNISFNIWVIDEDQFDIAYDLFEQYQSDPENPKWVRSAPSTIHQPSQETIEVGKKKTPLKTNGLITQYLLYFCIGLFVFSSFSRTAATSSSPDAALAPLYSSPIRKIMMFDFPKKYELLNQILEQPNQPNLIREFQNTSVWQGIYPLLLHPMSGWSEAPLFEKILQGQVWRLITPVFLHGDLFHLFFNMVWLFVLGRQMEKNLGATKYILFILIVGIASNMAQYLMTGANFLGFSGVLCGMLSYIHIRQQQAPWERYTLQPVTYRFMVVFIFFMAGFQLLAFISSTLFDAGFTTGLANTAHISGLGVGYLLGYTKKFHQK